MTAYYSYITKDGDSWDLIANKFYKNPSKYEPIIKAKPDVPITPILDSETIKFTLPPWKE